MENEEIENGVESEEISMTWDVLRNFFLLFYFQLFVCQPWTDEAKIRCTCSQGVNSFSRRTR